MWVKYPPAELGGILAYFDKKNVGDTGKCPKSDMSYVHSNLAFIALFILQWYIDFVFYFVVWGIAYRNILMKVSIDGIVRSKFSPPPAGGD